MKKSHSKLFESEPVCMRKEGWFVGLGQDGGVVCVRMGELFEIP